MNFSEALQLVKEGNRLKRKGWNNPNQWVFLLDTHRVNQHANEQLSEGLKNTFIDSFLVIKTVQNKLVPWIASQTDLLAEDWEVIE